MAMADRDFLSAEVERFLDAFKSGDPGYAAQEKLRAAVDTERRHRADCARCRIAGVDCPGDSDLRAKVIAAGESFAKALDGSVAANRRDAARLRAEMGRINAEIRRLHRLLPHDERPASLRGINYGVALEKLAALLRLFSERPKAREYLDALTMLPGYADAPMLPEALKGAEAFYWSVPMVRMMAEVSADMPDLTLTPAYIETPAAFWWLAEPLRAEGAKDLTGLVWYPFAKKAPNAIPDLDAADGMYVWLLDGVQPITRIAWRFGQAFTDIDLGKEARPYLRTFRFLPAALAFLSQRLIVRTRARADRATRKRLDDVFPHEPEIGVIELRHKTIKVRKGEQGDPVEWACRWAVRGHWRQQAVGEGRRQRRPLWIAPFWKGPEDKPVKVTPKRVFAVIR